MHQAAEPRLFLVREEDAPTYDAGDRPHMTMIEDDVIDTIGSSLGASSLAVYVVLERRCDASGTCHPSQETLGKALKLSERWIREAVGRLVEAGFVTVEKRANRFGFQASDSYALPYHPRTYRAEVPPEGFGQSTSAKVSVLRTPPIPLNDEETNPQKVKPSTSRARDADPAGFARWWEVWPKKENKKDALKAWLRINPDETLVEQMIAAVVEQRIAEREYRYMPHPATWLNGERWTNVAPPQGALNGTKPGELSLDDLIRAGGGMPQ